MSDVTNKISVRFVKPPSSIKPRLLRTLVAKIAIPIIEKEVTTPYYYLNHENETIVFFTNSLSDSELNQLIETLKKSSHKAKVILSLDSSVENQNIIDLVNRNTLNIDALTSIEEYHQDPSNDLSSVRILLESIVTESCINCEDHYIGCAAKEKLEGSKQSFISSKSCNQLLENFCQSYSIPKQVQNQAKVINQALKTKKDFLNSEGSSYQLMTDSINFCSAWKINFIKPIRTIEELYLAMPELKKLLMNNLVINHISHHQIVIILVIKQQLAINLSQPATIKTLQHLGLKNLQKNEEQINQVDQTG
jgi:hypothetical protein